MDRLERKRNKNEAIRKKFYSVNSSISGTRRKIKEDPGNVYLQAFVTNQNVKV